MPIKPSDLPVDLLSVVLFGPGTGEAVVVRLPDGRFGVVDGCAAGIEDGTNPVYALLKEAGVERLAFAALTHPHEDHLLGLDEVIDNFYPEKLWISGVEHPRVFRSYVERLQQRSARAVMDAQRPDEAQVLTQVINSFEVHGRRRDVTTSTLSDEKVLARWPDPEGAAVKISGLLPTTTSVKRALAWLGSDSIRALTEPDEDPLPDDVEDKRGDVNEVSSMLLVEWGSARILLGGDVLRGPRRGRQRYKRGLAWVWQQGCLPSPIQVVKVPHHASSGAHLDPLWAHLNPSVALISPYKSASGNMPPQSRMLRKILGSSCQVGLTARPSWWDRERHSLTGFPAAQPVTAVGIPGRNTRSRRRTDNALLVVLNSDGAVVRRESFGEARWISQSTPTRTATEG